MTLTQPETDALVRTWRTESAQPHSAATAARLNAVLRALQDSDPAAMRAWLVHGGDIGVHFGNANRTATLAAARTAAKPAARSAPRAQAREPAHMLATDLADGDTLDHTLAAPFFIDDLLDDREQPNTAPNRSAPARKTQAPAPHLNWQDDSPAEPRADTFTVESHRTMHPWRAPDDVAAEHRIQHPIWRKVGALWFALATFMTQTALCVTLISTAYAWQTGHEISRDTFQLVGGACAAALLLWVLLRTVRRFTTINNETGLALTARRAVKLFLVSSGVGIALAVMSQAGLSLLAGGGNTGVYVSFATLGLAILWNLFYFHRVPLVDDMQPRQRRWWSDL